MDRENAPLLKTKFYIPSRRPNLIARPRLAAQLEEALRLQHRLILVSARAGSGKTTLVSEWLHAQARPYAWLSLDEEDNDPQRFFSYLVAALRQLKIKISPAQPDVIEFPSPEPLLTELINDIAASSTSFLLVLDDYHILENDWIHKAVGFLVEHQPPGMHLVLTTRADPQLPLAQLRARGQLTEIRDRDLRFTAGETVEFLNEVMRLDLPAQAIATIERRTEGWIAGLQMTGISVQSHRQSGDVEAFIEAFGGTHRFILDYLMEEVLNHQPPAVQDFLIETSMLERMSADLCHSVHPGETDSQSLLMQLERMNLFVIPLDDERRWYRYHHLFADLLQSVLRQRRSPEQIRELHRRAGEWYLEAELPGEAMDHILAAGEFERAAAMIDENIARLIHMFSPKHESLLLKWIERLPEEIKRSRPWIDVYRANMLALNLQLQDVDSILDEAEKRVQPDTFRAAEILGYIAVVRAYAANLRGDAARSIAMADLAQKHLAGTGNLAARAMVAFTVADTYFAMDDMQHADQAVHELLEIGEKADQLIIIVPALSDLADVAKVRGRLGRAEEYYARAWQEMAKRNALDSRVRCSYEFGMAELLRERNQLAAARAHMQTGTDYRRRFGAYLVIGDLPRMRILQAQGDLEGALKALHAAEQAVQTHPFQLALMIEFRVARVLQWLAAGDVKTASRWAEECSGGSEQEQLALARLWLAQDRAAQAQTLLARQRARAETGGRTGRLIEILALQALALDAQGRSAEADEALLQALSLAQPEGYVRIFLDLGLPLHELLVRASKRGADLGGYVQSLLSAFGQEQSPTPRAASSAEVLIDPLTERELEVLHWLAEGLSNKEIAGRLVVAPGTIKQHLKNICRKLAVHGRLQAVRRAQELKLL
jgi:LuxR family maltose regulon positive regulatory protein